VVVVVVVEVVDAVVEVVVQIDDVEVVAGSALVTVVATAPRRGPASPAGAPTSTTIATPARSAAPSPRAPCIQPVSHATRPRSVTSLSLPRSYGPPGALHVPAEPLPG
jgi:hypothetical protein